MLSCFRSSLSCSSVNSFSALSVAAVESPSEKLNVINKIIETLKNKRNGFAYVCLFPSLNSRAKTPGFVKMETIEFRNLES